ncbi:MAG: 50S ribosomal protein L37ae [Candidatus Aenigmatarchaeota archaeon]
MPVGYGKRLRQSVATVKRKKTKHYACPSCSRTSVKRLSTGVWQCKKCKTKFASKAYEFS